MADAAIIRSFAGGELSPALSARADLAKYTVGLRRCRNFVIQRHGGATTRPGFRFVNACKTTSSKVRLLRYVSEIPAESVLIEMGVGYFRFYQQGALVELAGVAAYSGGTAYVPGDIVESGGVNYYCVADTTGNAPPNASFWYAMPGDILEVPHGFADPEEAQWVQSGRIITLTHHDNPPTDLVFESLTRWVVVEITTAPVAPAPGGLGIAGTSAGARTFAYVVTTAAPGSYEESLASAQLVAAGVAEPTPDAPHAITWTPVTVDGVAADEYYVYCDPFVNGTFGFLGTATGAAAFNNPGLTPDFSITPPLERELFDVDGNYPATCAYHQQRRFLANTEDEPDAIWASRTAFYDNFNISSPLQDDDAITFRIAGNNHHPVRHLVALKNLLVFTDGGEWRVQGGSEGIIAPNSIDPDQETYVGIDPDVRPVVIGNSVIYLQARGSIIRELRFDRDVEGLAGRDLTIYAAHLFDGYTMTSKDFAQAPHSIVWVVRSDGTLLGLTYLHDQDIWGWHRHDTGAAGAFERVCVVPEPGEDVLYAVVRRTIGGATVRYIERLESRTILVWNEDVFFVDSGLSYQGAATSTVTGLAHLNGQTVSIIADGTYRGAATVSAGSVAVPGAAASDIHVGLPIEADLETLDLDVQGANIRDKKKRVQGAALLVDASSRAFYAGSNGPSNLTQYTPPLYDDPTDVQWTGRVELNFTSRFDHAGRVFVRQNTGLPLTILGVLPYVEAGS